MILRRVICFFIGLCDLMIIRILYLCRLIGVLRDIVEVVGDLLKKVIVEYGGNAP